MNRLILIGNGFDLAHNLETSYCHFITDYITNAINNFFANNLHEDPLLKLKFKYSGHGFNAKDKNRRFKNSEAWEVLKNISNSNNHEVHIKSNYLSQTIEQISKTNWVDLENDYFDRLVGCKRSDGYNLQEVKKLNTEFDFLKKELEKYLLRHETENEIEFSQELLNLFYESIRSEDIVTTSIADEVPKRLLFLSFNYTKTLTIYKEQCKNDIPTEINYIHGQLNSKTNPIIFGFGDEYNKNYLEFEELRNKELLKHIKSFGYFRSSNYHDLIRFLESDEFQVYIFGHSLGLSDRTMLKQIFEHEKCKSIKLFYHGDDVKNDYTDKTYDISSHFSDKGLMRKKIVPFDKSFRMPQPGYES